MELDKSVLRKAASTGAGPVGIFVTATGFFCDFVKPFINLVPYFFFAFLFFTIFVWLFFVKKKLKQVHVDHILETKVGKLFGISVIATGFWLVMIPFFAFTPQQGIAASISPTIANWQEQLFGKLDRIENKIDKVLDKIDQMKDGDAGLITHPVTSNDFYHNARIQEINGNLIEARKAYEQYFKSKLEYIDPYISYAQILKNLEGPSTTREIMGQMREANFESPAANLGYIITKEDRMDRLQLLEELTQKHPDYGPTYYYIAQQYSTSEAGQQTNDERRKEREALEKLINLEKDQKFSKFYIDKKISDEAMSWVQSEIKMMEGPVGNMIDQAIQFKINMNGKSTTVTFTPSELVTKIYYRFDKKGEFKDTGTMDARMPGMTEPLPNYFVVESLPEGKHMVEAKYVDIKGQESPVYEYKFSVDAFKVMNPPYRMVDPDTGKPEYMFLWTVYNEDKDYHFFYSIDNQNLDREVLGSGGGITVTDVPPGKHTLYVYGIADGQKTNIVPVEFEAS